MSSSGADQETSNSSTSEDGKNNSLNSVMNGKNRNSTNNNNGNNKKSPIKQQANTSPHQQQNQCTWCADKQPLKYVLPTQNGKKEFCSETCIAEFRKAYNKGACKECDNAIRNGPNRDFCSTYCLNKNNKKKIGNQQQPSTSQTKTLNNNNNNSIENNNSKQKSSSSGTSTTTTTTTKTSTLEANNNNTLIKEHYAMTKISPMFQYEAFHVFDWNEYLKVSICSNLHISYSMFANETLRKKKF